THLRPSFDLGKTPLLPRIRIDNCGMTAEHLYFSENEVGESCVRRLVPRYLERILHLHYLRLLMLRCCGVVGW
ncbi:hypothetical protein PFISCL1PPCAC_28155, partial [Pristionchus fissidentatus]